MVKTTKSRVSYWQGYMEWQKSETSFYSLIKMTRYWTFFIPLIIISFFSVVSGEGLIGSVFGVSFWVFMFSLGGYSWSKRNQNRGVKTANKAFDIFAKFIVGLLVLFIVLIFLVSR